MGTLPTLHNGAQVTYGHASVPCPTGTLPLPTLHDGAPVAYVHVSVLCPYRHTLEPYGHATVHCRQVPKCPMGTLRCHALWARFRSLRYMTVPLLARFDVLPAHYSALLARFDSLRSARAHYSALRAGFGPLRTGFGALWAR